MADNKDDVTYLARMFSDINAYIARLTGGKTKLAAAQTLKPRDGDAIEVDADGAVTSGQADGDYVLEDGSTVTIKDGKLGEVKPAPAPDNQDKTGDNKSGDDKGGEQAPEGDQAGEGDPADAGDPGKQDEQPVTQQQFQTLVDAVAALVSKCEDMCSNMSKAELARQDAQTKLSAEVEDLKRQPAVGKQGPPTIQTPEVDKTKLSLADAAALAAQAIGAKRSKK